MNTTAIDSSGCEQEPPVSKKTPTTADVRATYSYDDDSDIMSQNRAEFDRWLAAHDAEVATLGIKKAFKWLATQM